MSKKNKTTKIGCIGTGWIGKHYADDFENRGYEVVRYSLEPKYRRNKNKIKDCYIVFVAVPTPTTPDGFSSELVEKCIKELTVDGQLVVIKSTVQIGTTDRIQKDNPKKYIFHCPEFLTESTAKHDVEFPDRNIIGYTDKSKNLPTKVLAVLPKAPNEYFVPAKSAELVKYMGNCYFYAKNMMTNIFYDLAKHNNLEYHLLRDMVIADPRMGDIHTRPIHKGGRGAGNHCLIKDLASLREMYEKMILDIQLSNKKAKKFHTKGYCLLKSLEDYNKELLKSSKKDLDILEGVYGK